MRFPPGAGTNPGGGAAAWSMTPGPVSGRAREPPAAGGGRSSQPSPPRCSPRRCSQATRISPYAPATLLSARVGHPCVEGRREPETEGYLCSTRCWKGPRGGVLEGRVLKFVLSELETHKDVQCPTPRRTWVLVPG